MKSFLILALSLFSVAAFAKYDYSCNMFPGEQGGYTYLIQVTGKKAKVFTVNYSEQESPIEYVTTLNQISDKNSLIKHYVENQDEDAIEFFIRKGAASLGTIDPRKDKFRIYSCAKKKHDDEDEDE